MPNDQNPLDTLWMTFPRIASPDREVDNLLRTCYGGSFKLRVNWSNEFWPLAGISILLCERGSDLIEDPVMHDVGLLCFSTRVRLMVNCYR